MGHSLSLPSSASADHFLDSAGWDIRPGRPTSVHRYTCFDPARAQSGCALQSKRGKGQVAAYELQPELLWQSHHRLRVLPPQRDFAKPPGNEDEAEPRVARI